MIKTEADLAKLTTRQREVLTALARQLSKDKVSQFLHICRRCNEYRRGSTPSKLIPPFKRCFQNWKARRLHSISPALASLAEEWQALTTDEKTTTQEPGETP
jgi:hypothetical protein